MKKILFSAAALALLATAGCTRNEDNGVKDDAQQISFTGEFTAADEFGRVEFVPNTAGTSTQRINWNPGDKIGICYTASPAFVGFNNPYVAATTTVANTTKFDVDPEGTPIEMDKTTTNTFYAYYPYNENLAFADGHSINHIPSPLKRQQTGDPATGSYPNASFMVASKPYAGEDVVSFKFSNVFPVMMIGFEGDAKIDRVIIEAPVGRTIYMEGFVDLTKAPAQGANFDEFTNGFFDLDQISKESSLEIAFSTPLTLVDGEVTYFPVMVAPFDYMTGDTFTFTVIGKNKNGQDIAVTRTATAGSDGTLGAGQFIYIDFYDRFAKEDFGQVEGGDTPGPVEPGEVIFEDDFSYICGIFDNPDNNFDKYGWVENRSLKAWGSSIIYDLQNHTNEAYKDDLDTNGKGFSALLTAKGWINEDGAPKVFGYNAFNGMIQLGDGFRNKFMGTIIGKGPGKLSLPLNGLIGDEPTDLTLTFKAARYIDRYGSNAEEESSKLTISVTGEGTQINGGTEVVIIPPYDAYADSPAWLHEFTIPVTGATAASTITFSNTEDTSVVYLDDVKICANNSESPDLTGTPVEKEPIDIIYTNAAPNYEIIINADADQTDDNGNYITTDNERLEFVCNGAWFMYEPNADWCNISSVNWSDKYDPNAAWQDKRLQDTWGNGIRNIFNLAATQTNTTGAERSCELKVLNMADYSTIATFTIIQPASENGGGGGSRGLRNPDPLRKVGWR